MRKRLIVAVLSIPLLLGGCSKKEYPCYDLPNDERICSINEGSIYVPSYSLTKQGGKVIEFFYEGDKNNPKVNLVKITIEGVTKDYNQKEVIEAAQKDLDGYLKVINQKEVEEGLEGLK